MSHDGGATFVPVEVLHANDPAEGTDRGSIAVGPAPPGSPAEGSLWVTYLDQSTSPQRIVARGAGLDAGGNPIVDFCGAGTGVFCVEQIVAESDDVDNVHPGHIAVGPNGQVLVAYQRWFFPTTGPTRIFAALDADGLEDVQGFAPPGTNPVLITNVGLREGIAPHFARRIAPWANLAWDRAAEPHGRLYLVSTTEEPQGSADTDIGLLTGHVVVAWHDPRNDPANRETELFLGFSADAGETFTNVSASDGFFSRASGSDPETSHGDYLGVDFHAGRAYAAWVDNSDLTMDNPDPACPADPSVRCMDVYVPEPGGAMQLLAAPLRELGAVSVRASIRSAPNSAQLA